MVDLQTVCCMCGDIGFPEKLFRCNNCRNRFQHSYCSNYYSESTEPIEVCDWCQCEGKITSSSKHRITSSNKSTPAGSDVTGSMNRSEYSGDKIKHLDRENTPADKGKNSPRPSTRRYKLLKDVMC